MYNVLVAIANIVPLGTCTTMLVCYCLLHLEWCVIQYNNNNNNNTMGVI